MKIDFYLSEMAVSDLHGGGLTLQRILGDDLLQIPFYVHLGRYTDMYPVIPQLKDRSVQVASRWDSDFARKIIGRTKARAMRKRLFAIKGAAKAAARLLNRSFKKGQPLKALICPQGAESIYALEMLKRYRPVKYISWVMDDHLVKYVNGEWQYPGEMEQVFGKHLREAEHVFVISPVMQQFYLEKFGVSSTILFSPGDIKDKFSYQVNTGNQLRIGYFGAVATWQTDALGHVADALTNTDAQLHIYSGIPTLPNALDKNNVELMGRLNPDEVLPTMQQYDAILLPMSFLERSRHLSEFNIATKMSEYLASGVPILAIGPPYAAMIKYLKESNAAVIVESGEMEDIKAAIKTLRDREVISNILNNAQTLVTTQTGTAIMKKRWQDLLNEYLS